MRRRIVADHARAVTFLIADGVYPSNTDRGYVLRFLIRRAVRNGRLLGYPAGFLTGLVPAVVASLAPGYPQLQSERETRRAGAVDGRERVRAHAGARQRDARRATGGRQGRLRAASPARTSSRCTTPTGSRPNSRARSRQRRASRSTRRASRPRWTSSANALAMTRRRAVVAVRDEAGGAESPRRRRTLPATPAWSRKTPYCGSSARVGRPSRASRPAPRPTSSWTARRSMPRRVARSATAARSHPTTERCSRSRIRSTRRTGNHVHRGALRAGELRLGDSVRTAVHPEWREEIRREHSSAHLLQRALKDVIGDDVVQAGSWVGVDRMRFDFRCTRRAFARADARPCSGASTRLIRADYHRDESSNADRRGLSVAAPSRWRARTTAIVVRIVTSARPRSSAAARTPRRERRTRVCSPSSPSRRSAAACGAS